MKKRVLGIDCSSSTIGIGVCEYDKKNLKYIACEYIKPIKSDDIAFRLADTRDKLLEVFDKYKPDEIVIEEIISYMPGKSSANTIIVLATFNRMASLLAYDYLGKSPKHYSVMDIRRGIMMNNIVPDKEDIPDLTAKILKIKFPWELNKNKKRIVENNDKADALAVCLFECYIGIGKSNVPLTIVEKKAKKKIIRAKRKARIKK